MIAMKRRTFLSMAGIAGMALLGGCSGASTTASASGQPSGNASPQASSASAQAPSTANLAPLTIGTLATEDILPLWVAQSAGLFSEAGIDVKVVPFQSATELISGVSSGEVDLAMTDIMVTASIFASGVDVSMQWVTLGTEADQGRFGIMVGPDSGVASLSDLSGIPIGVGSNTILEYVMDKLMYAAGIAEGDIVVEELQKLPVRYQAMASGEVAAAALPGTLLALGEASGCKLIADDTRGENLSQSVMIAHTELLAGEAQAQRITLLKAIWDKAAQLINDDPESYREILVDNANLPVEIADTYPISVYPTVQLPTNDMVKPVLDWMQQKGYLAKELDYDETRGTFSVR